MSENDYTPNAPENFCTKNNTGHDLLQQNFNRTFFPTKITNRITFDIFALFPTNF